MIRILLILAIVFLMLWFLGNRNTSKIKAGKKLAIVAFLLFAVFAVALPESTNSIANFFGVGRGADLLLYILTVTFFAYVLNQYLKSKTEEQRIVKLARKIAIIEANERYTKK